MTKKWNKIDKNNYKLFIDEVEIGLFKLNEKSTNSEVIASFLGKEFKIYRTGFWKSNIEVVDNENNIISKIYNKKWYGSSFVIEFYDKKLNLIIKNNPLIEWSIYNEDDLILSYALDTSNKDVGLKITQPVNNKLNEENDYLLDFLLWYLFLPVISENSDEELLMFILLTS